MANKRRRSPRGLYIIGIILLLDIVITILFINRWQLRIQLRGEAEMHAECGSDFVDPGAEAEFGGERFLPRLFHPEVKVQGEVDTRQPGDYTLLYSSEFLWYSDSCSRVVRVSDTTPPEITLQQLPGSYTLPGSPYEEEGYTALDVADGDLTPWVERREEGGFVYYQVSDRAGNVARAERQIIYDDPIPPILTLLGGDRVTLAFGTDYREPGYTALDNADGDITASVRVTGEVDPNATGEYELRYEVEDSWHNRAEAVRTVTVEREPAGVVYLTFDDGPSKHTQELLDILDKYDVKVTFFVVNYGYNDMIGKEAAAGHSIGVHSATHDYHEIYASEEAFFADLQAMNDIIYAQTGAYSDLIRFPGGSSNTISSFNPGIMTRLTQAVVEKGYQYFDWNVSSEDAGGTTDPDQVYQNVIDGIRGRKTSVVLMHDSKSHTVAAVERIIIWCLDNGYELRPLTKDSPASHHNVSN
jgi:peptidoglycan/xylan/chitin deacetylase (PgdA/CDA1 family)